MEIRKALVERDQNNLTLQNYLSVSYDDIGDMLVLQHKFDEALVYYRDSLAIREALVAADPTDTDWRRNLSVSFSKLGAMQMNLGNNSKAVIELRKGREIVADLLVISPGNALYKSDLVSFDREIAEANAN